MVPDVVLNRLRDILRLVDSIDPATDGGRS
jgi:hypothetical protein